MAKVTVGHLDLPSAKVSARESPVTFALSSRSFPETRLLPGALQRPQAPYPGPRSLLTHIIILFYPCLPHPEYSDFMASLINLVREHEMRN